MRTPRPLAAALLALGCLEAPPPRRSRGVLTLLRVESATGDPRALGRVPSLRLRFDRPLRLPRDDDFALLRGEAGASASSDLERPPLSPANASRRVPLRASVDGSSPETLRVDALSALPPDAELTLLLSTRVTALDGAALDAPVAEALRVASVSRCGALAALSLPGAASATPGAIPLRFDRGVRGDGPTLTLVDARGELIPSAARLDCADVDGFARCAWLTPLVTLREGAYAVRLGALRTRSGAGCEGEPLGFEVGAEGRDTTLDFARPLPCAAEEVAFGGVCARVSASEVTLRAATTAPAVVRARAVPDDQGDPREALSGPGTAHALRVTGLRPLIRHALSLWAMDARGEPAYLPLGAIETTAPQGDLRITEVLARPRGPGAQEFVELENVGAQAVALRGWSLASGGAASVFEGDLALAPGARALVVGAGFDVRGSPRTGDPSAAPGAMVLAVRGSVGGRGLRDDGADLVLRDPTGRQVSAFPGAAVERAPRAGVSLSRAAWDLDEDDPHAWSYDRDGGSTPGAPNRVE